MLSNPSLRLNGIYYITKQILPALDRALSILGVNVYPWYTELPRIQRPTPAFISDESSSKKGTIGQYFTSLHCPICEKLTTDNICTNCSKRPHLVSITLSSRIQQAERNYSRLSLVNKIYCNNIKLSLSLSYSFVRIVVVMLTTVITWNVSHWTVQFFILVKQVYIN